MNDLHNNEKFNWFKYQLEDEQKIIILYILRNFPQEIKDGICEAINQAIDKYLLGSQYDKNFYLGTSEYAGHILYGCNYGNL